MPSKCLTRYNVLHAARVRIGLVNVCIYLMSGKRFFGTLFDSARDPGSIAVRTRYTFGVREHIEQLSVVIAGACCPALYWFVPV